MHLAVGTSFSIIVPTSIVSLLTHNKHGSVDFTVIKNYAVFVIIGVLSGTTFAALMDSESLLLFFTIIVFLCGAYLLNIKDKTDKLKVNFNLIPRILLGFVSDGLDDEVIVDKDGDVWHLDEYGDKGGGMNYMWDFL